MYFYLLLNLYLQIGSQQTCLNRKFIITHTLHSIQHLNVMKYGGVQSAMGFLSPIVTQKSDSPRAIAKSDGVTRRSTMVLIRLYASRLTIVVQ